jgi:hypothetical protein
MDKIVMADQTRLVIVDTNCYVRLYYSKLRPILGSVVNGHRLVTLHELANESKGGGLVERNGWLSAQDIQHDIQSAVFPLSDEQQAEYTGLAKEFRQMGDHVLHEHCKARNISLRYLSLADAKALAVAADFNAILATDEWPLRLVSTKVELDDGKQPQLFSSLDLLQLLEIGQKITRDERAGIVKEWLRAGEHLLTSWRADYQVLFNEAPPTAQ